jgi:predicted nucleotidyltransferase
VFGLPEGSQPKYQVRSVSASQIRRDRPTIDARDDKVSLNFATFACTNRSAFEKQSIWNELFALLKNRFESIMRASAAEWCKVSSTKISVHRASRAHLELCLVVVQHEVELHVDVVL